MRFFFYSPFFYEPWDYTNPDAIGIGGSETCQIELAWRLARRGHEIVSFAPLPDSVDDKISFQKTHKGVSWRFSEASSQFCDEPGIWVLSRCPPKVDDLPKTKDQKIWLVCQDVDYHGLFTEERLEKLDLILALNPTHAKYLAEKYPEFADKIRVSSNGIKTELVEETEKLGIQRNPLRLVYTSSPDRGLVSLLKIFKRAREFEPGLELIACYGLDNLNKGKGEHFRRLEREIVAETQQPGVTWAGRLPQPELYKLIASAGIWCYPSNFTETSAISCMEAQTLGAVPIFHPIWALAHNVRHGIAIAGDANDTLVRCRYVSAIIRLTRQLDLQNRVRSEMTSWAKGRFDWERVVDQYETGFVQESEPLHQEEIDQGIPAGMLAELQRIIKC